MEGKYLTKSQRAGAAQQIRKTHFTLGCGGNYYNTTSKNLLKAPQTPEAAQRFTALSKDLRKTHLLMGTDTKEKISEFKFSYPPKSIQDSNEKFSQKDLRKTNMVLGTTDPQYNTSSLSTFKGASASIQHVKSAQQIERNLRKHHFDLGTDLPTQRTTFASDFHQKTSEKTLQNQELKNDLRSSHFDLGRAPKMMKTTSQREFALTEREANTFNKDQLDDLRRQHFELGTDRPNYNSTHSHFFVAKAEGRQDLNIEKMKDLRNSHVVLGKAPACYSLASGSFKPQSASPVVLQKDSSIKIKDTHFKLGTEVPMYKSSYLGSHVSPPPAQENVYKANSQRHLSSSVKFGSTALPLSNSQASFKPPKAADIGKPDPKLIKELRNHHFRLGVEGNHYNTTSSQVGTGKGEASHVDKNIVKDLRASHFKVGGDSNKFLSTHQLTFRAPHGEAGKVDEALAKNLRKTHFLIGQGNNKWMSENQDKFKWVQPVPDSDFKISLI